MRYKLKATEDGLCLTRGEQTVLRGLTGAIRYPGTQENELRLSARGAWCVTEGREAACENMRLELAESGEGALLRMTMRCERDVAAGGEIALSGTLASPVARALTTRYTCVNGHRLCEMRSQIDTVIPVAGAVYESADGAAFDCENGAAWALGAATQARYFSGVTLSREGYICLRCDLEKHPLAAGEAVAGEWFCLMPGADCREALEAYAGALGALAGVKESEAENPAGYCTWYYYLNDVTPADFLENVRALTPLRGRLPLKIMQLDDGWFDLWGSWQANERFGDMRALASRVREAGFRPGLWLAPFGVHPDCAIAREHPDWFVHTRAGEIWRGLNLRGARVLSLDATHPQARAYLQAVIRRLTWEWGFEYLKIDIITDTLAPGVHFDRHATALENYRLGLRAIREAMKPGTFLLGCTAPMIASAGFVDGMRVSCDVFERWESLRDVFNAALKRWYLHRRLYLIDADCLLVRTAAQEDGRCRRPCTRSEREIRTYVTAMAASGGALMLSDKIGLLTEAQLSLIASLFPLSQRPARPLDLMESFIPGTLDFGERCGARTVAFINWSECEREMSVKQGDCFAFEFWSRACALHRGECFSVRVPPHEARVYAFTPLSEMALIGSDAALVLQTRWEREADGIAVERLKEGETVYLALPRAPRDARIVGQAEAHVFCALPLAQARQTVCRE